MKMRFLILPSLLALSALGAAPHHAPLPALPTTMFSKYGAIPIDRVHEVVCPDSSGTTPPKVIGCYNHVERRVQIADTLDARWSWLVYWHERTHVNFRELHVTFSDRMDEERIAWAIALYSVAEMEAR